VKKSASIAILTILLACSVSFFSGAQAQSSNVKSVRGTAIEETTPAPATHKQNTTGRFKRAYRQQPPMIPHKIRGYQIDLKVNKCMSCHDWPNNVEQGAPKISETHYIDRQGVALDHVARTRWFCTQCHVPQVNATELVPNSFKSALDVD
jgi:nitrate reductase (cytochrome), electron transfer subunit